MIDLNTAQSYTMAPPDTNGFKAADDEATFPTIFARNVATHANKPAIVSANQSITYAELNEQAECIAALILTCTGNHAEPIGLLFQQEISAFAATIGVLKSGHFYVTLDPLDPLARLAEILTDAGARILLTSDNCMALVRQLCPKDLNVINVDALPAHVTKLPPPPIAPDAYAYIGYTSGSTGKAKGVIETHRNHIWHWHNLMQAQPAYGKERVLFLNRLSFSGGQLAFYLAFLAGATLYLYDLQTHGIVGLPGWIQQHRITVWNSVPTIFRAFVAQVTTPAQVASIRLLRLASDTILAQDIDAYRRLFAPDCKLWFCYALTEAKTVTMAFLERNVEIAPTSIPSGWPIAGMEIQIVDDMGRQLGPNQVGEIIVRSRYVSPGYWRNAALTGARFQPDPDAAGIYLLQTGDLGKVDEYGCLFHKGRIDNQVKIRGYRVELSEIEAHLAAFDGIQEAAVRIHTSANNDVQLAAYVVSHNNTSPNSSQLRLMLKERLPAYMIPNTFTVLDRMPVNRNGKIDRAALPAPIRPALDMPLTPARTALEATLVAIWQEVLGVQPIGIHDNFFDVGGHSLLAVTLYHQIAKATGQSLPPSVVLQASTVAQQAAMLCESAQQARWSSLVALRSDGSRPPLFLVPPANGSALSFIKLVRYLEPDQPLYAFDPVGSNGIAEPLGTIEAMATHYINEMRTFQPEGPYRLGGQCMGGHVAFEMARQLLEQGSAIEALVILDSGAPFNGPDWEWSQPQRTWGDYWRQVKRTMARTVRFALNFKWYKFKKVITNRRRPGKSLAQIHRAAQIHYAAMPIAQHIFLVQSEEFANKPKNQRRWAALALGGLTLQVVAGATHGSLFAKNDNHIALLACYLQAYLNQLTQPVALD